MKYRPVCEVCGTAMMFLKNDLGLAIYSCVYCGVFHSYIKTEAKR